MDELPLVLMVSAFQSHDGAEIALKDLEVAGDDKPIGMQAMAIVWRDAADTLHVRERAAWGGDQGAMASALIGGAIGLLFPSNVLATGPLGASFADLGAHLRESGFSDARLKTMGETLVPGTSAIIAIVEQPSAARIKRQLAKHGAETVQELLGAEIFEKLAHPSIKED